jgi:Mg-chelatase subunit ChlD/HEAT repeat protein
MLLALFLTLLSAALGGLAHAGPALPGPVQEISDDPLAQFSAEPERASRELLLAVAELGSAGAGVALAEHYTELSNLGLRLTAIEALGRFLEVEGARQNAMSRLVGVASEERNRELRLAAIERLAGGGAKGREGLEILIEAPTEDEVRIEAMRAHVAGGGGGDAAFYTRLWKGPEDDGSKKKPRKGEEEEPVARRLASIRRMAFVALAPTLELEELAEQAGDGDWRVRGAVLAQLDARGAEAAGELAQKMLKQQLEAPENRVLAAEVLLALDPEDALDELVDLGTHRNTPGWLAAQLADLYRRHAPADVAEKFAKKLGKGKAPDKLFAIQAVGQLPDEKVAKALLKLLDDKEPEVRLAAIEAVGERREEVALEELAERIDPETEPLELDAVLEAVGRIRERDGKWVMELREMTSSASETIRNAALRELIERDDAQLTAVLGAALDHADWSTRALAVEGLEELRTAAATGLLVGRMPAESGRLRSAIGEALFRLSGKSFGRKADSWTRWWADSQGDYAPISRAELAALEAEQRARRLEESTSAGEFFGLEIESTAVTFVVDVSGSMEERTRGESPNSNGEQRMAVARRELDKFLDGLQPETYFNLIVFSDRVQEWAGGLQRATTDNVEQARAYVAKLNPGGGTNLFEAVMQAFNDRDMDTLIVLSDGEPSVGMIREPNALREMFARVNRTRGVVIHTVQIGLELDILRWLAEDSGGTTVFIP